MPAVPFNENELPPVLPQSPAGPTFGETLTASMREENMMVSFAMRLHQGFYPPVDGYNPWDDIKDNEFYRSRASAFAGSRSPEQSYSIMRRLDQEENDRRTLAASGNMGVVAGLISSVDPTWALPGRIAVGAYRAGSTAIRGAVEVGLAGGVQSAAQQAGLYATQPDRSVKESVMSVGSATLLSAFLGAGIGALSPAEKFAHTTALNVDRARADAHVRGETLHEGFPAWHGSPYELESFDRSRINTGEGNQSFSRGIYVAENPDVARFYAGMRRRQAEQLQRRYDRARGMLGVPEEAEAEAAAMATHPADEVLHGEYPSNVYQVHVHIDRDHFLDWDKPISEQTPFVRDVLRRSGVEHAEVETGQTVMTRLIEKEGPEQATKILNDTGLPGVKYLDAKSRAAGEGTRNYVLYDEHKARVTHRNGEQILPFSPAAEVRPGEPHAAPGGAGIVDERTMEDLTPVGGPLLRPLLKLGDNVVTRSLLKSSLAVRRLATELSETAVLVKGNIPKVMLDAEGKPLLNAEGKPMMTVKTTTPGGMSPIDIQVRAIQNTTEAQIIRWIEEAWAQHNFGGTAPKLAKFRDTLQIGGRDFSGLPSDRMTFEQFSQQVGDAAMSTTPHENPLVQGVADKVNKIFEEWSGRAEKSVPGFKRAEQIEGENYFPHDWIKNMIAAKRPQFVDQVTEKFMADQAANVATQGRVRSHQGAIKQHEANIEKFTSQLEKKQADLAKTEDLRDEVSKINKLGFQRATALRESEAAAEIGRRGGAPFETAARKRINTLADRASAYLHEVADIEEKLQAEHASIPPLRAKIEEEIGNWHGQSGAEAKFAVKAREKFEAEREAKRAEKAGEEPKAGRSTQADKAVDRAVEGMLNSRQDLSLEEMRNDVEQVVHHIMGSPDGRFPFDSKSADKTRFLGAPLQELRGSLAERLLDVSNEFAKPWIERDINKVMKKYMRTFVPDVLLAERYGDIEMKVQMRQIQDEYTDLIRAVPDGPKAEKERTRLNTEMNNAIADIAMLRDRLRGTFQVPVNESQRRIGRIASFARNFSHFTSMGMAAASSIPDAGNVVARWGLNSVFNDAWAPFTKALATMDKEGFVKEVYRQFGVMGILNETLLNTRHHSFIGITEPYTQGSLAERTLQKGADLTQLANLMSPQTDLLKAIAATVASTGIYRAAKRAAEGKATKLDLLQLGQANIRPDLYEHIAAQYEKSGTLIDGHLLPNTEAWTHSEARSAFEAAVHRDVNLSVVTPGIDKPGFISDPVLSVFTQFKQFTAAATTRILIANLQRADAHTLQGLIANLGFGAMAYFVHSVVSGQPMSDKPGDWVKEAVSRSGYLGWLDEANTVVSKMSRGRVDMYRAVSDKPLSRQVSQNAVETLLGPTVGKLSNLTRVTGAMASREVNAGDIHALRRLGGWQNMWFMNRALTEVEKSVGGSLGIQQQQRRQ